MTRCDGSLQESEIRELQFDIAGLQDNVEILLDRWGVPHIYAANIDDVFFAQGWNAARDRLWQMDLWRRRGLGQLAAALGDGFIEQDRAIRLFIYRGDMEKEWAAYGADAKPRAEAFVRGINAYVAAVRSGEAPMPLEFEIAGYAPSVWSVEDLVRVRTHGVVFSGAARQVAHASVVSKTGSLGPDLPIKISPSWRPLIPEGLDLGSIPANVLDVYNLARRPVFLDPKLADLPQGSNNWVVTSSKTCTGRPILANDPHRAFEIPSLRYLVHLNAPELDVIGAGQPALPGIEIGHNGQVAFGLTILPVAHEDLLVYDTNPEDPNQYRYEGAWQSMRITHENIVVKGKPDVAAELKFTRHGPVILEDRAKHRAYAIRAAWLDTGGAPYFGAMSYLQAKDREQFASALKSWGGPGENHVCADIKGNIGWFAAGSTPIRGNSDGLLPLPGDGRYEWNGYLEQRQLPAERDPARGYIATANQLNLPKDYPYEKRPVTFTWYDDARFRRVSAVLDGLKGVSLEDCQTLQNDCVSLPAQSLIRTLREIPLDRSEIRELALWLTDWDGRAAAESAQAALFEIWLTNHLIPALLTAVAPNLPKEFCPYIEQSVVATLMSQPDTRLGEDPVEARNALMLRTLTSAAKEAQSRLGPDRTLWRWGSLATILFEHPFSKIASADSQPRLNVGPAPFSGDGSSVALALYQGTNFRVYAGASVRLIVDVGNWDASLAVNTPGQSGDPLNSHYDDLFPLWLEGKYFQLAYSRPAVEKVTESRLVLRPAGSTTDR